MAIRSTERVGGCADAEFSSLVRAARFLIGSAWLRRWLKAALCGLPVLMSAASWRRQFRPQMPPRGCSDRRQIEEVVVTAERKESTVSDTSISITAFTGQMLEDFGIRNQEDLQKFIPAAVIEPYDMAIRGVGRNFRALGGDPGIATYLNGVYSEDFGIASTEGGLFDIERIEVLRGPQGTLYGRNAIGGAVNFINKLPTNEFEGEARVVGGNYDLREEYGVLSGPLIDNILCGALDRHEAYPRRLHRRQVGQPESRQLRRRELCAVSALDADRQLRVQHARQRAQLSASDGWRGCGRYRQPDRERRYARPGHGRARNTSSFAWGYRRVDPSIVCPTLVDRTEPELHRHRPRRANNAEPTGRHGALHVQRIR